MLSEFVKNRDALQALTADRHLSYYRGWHMWTVTLPRRSITGRLVWGKVWRRRDNGRWIYKKYVESPEAVERLRAVRTLVSKTSTNGEQSAKRGDGVAPMSDEVRWGPATSPRRKSNSWASNVNPPEG